MIDLRASRSFMHTATPHGRRVAIILLRDDDIGFDELLQPRFRFLR